MLKTERWLTDNYLGTTNKISVAGKTTPSVFALYEFHPQNPCSKKTKGQAS